MKKHIVIDARESGTTTGRYVDKLIEHLASLNPEHSVTLLAKPHRRKYLAGIAPAFSVTPCYHKEFSIAEQTALFRQIRGLKPNLVHFPMAQQPLLYAGKKVTSILDLTTARFRNPQKNLVVFWIRQQIYKLLVITVAKRSGEVICISDYVSQDLVKFAHINPGKISVTYLAADRITEKALPITGLKGKQFIMYVGRPQPHKNLGRLIDAFKLLKETHPDLVLVLAGKLDDLYRTHQKRVHDEAIANVVFTDFITDQQLRWLYENCAAYVFPSLSEGFGLPGVEAMLHGAPLASSNATCLPEVYGDAAAYFDPTNSVEMATTIHAVITDDKLRETLIRKGTKQCKKYSWKKTAQQTLEVYNRVLGS